MSNGKQETFINPKIDLDLGKQENEFEEFEEDDWTQFQVDQSKQATRSAQYWDETWDEANELDQGLAAFLQAKIDEKAAQSASASTASGDKAWNTRKFVISVFLIFVK